MTSQATAASCMIRLKSIAACAASHARGRSGTPFSLLIREQHMHGTRTGYSHLHRVEMPLPVFDNAGVVAA